MIRMLRTILPTSLLVLFAAGCSQCQSDPTARPNIVVPPPVTGAASAPSAAGTAPTPTAAAASAAAPAMPVLPQHETPPTLADFAVTPIVGDWLGFKGGNQRSGLRDAPAILNPEIRWSTKIGVQGYTNNIVVTSDAIYASSQGDDYDKPDANDGVVKLSKATGEILWRANTPDDANGIVLAGKVVVVGTDSKQLLAFDANDGHKVWELDAQCRVYQPPTLVGEELLLVRKEGFARINIQNGSVRGALGDCLEGDRGSITAVADEIFRVANRMPLRLYKGDAPVWEAQSPPDHPGNGRWVPPTVLSNVIVDIVHRWDFQRADGEWEGRPGAIARWKDNGQIIWQADIDDPKYADPTPGTTATPYLRTAPFISGDRLFWTSRNAGRIVAFNLLSGQRVESLDLPDCRTRQFSSIVGTSSMGYLARHDGVLYGFTLNPLKMSWSISLGLHGAVGGRRTHAPTNGSCTHLPIDGTGLFSTPAIDTDGTVFVGSGDGWLYAIGNKP